MKHLIAILILVIAASMPAVAQKKADQHAAKHGGIVMETKEADLELVAKSDGMTVYASDHDGKPIKLTGASGKVTVFSAGAKTEAPLTLAGDRIEAKGNFKLEPGTRVLVEVSLNRKPAVAARFTLK